MFVYVGFLNGFTFFFSFLDLLKHYNIICLTNIIFFVLMCNSQFSCFYYEGMIYKTSAASHDQYDTSEDYYVPPCDGTASLGLAQINERKWNACANV